jgi:ribonuclease HII
VQESPDLLEEKLLISRGYKLIAGIDEAGRGALAGPVVAAAVILPRRGYLMRLNSVRDSKMITPARRDCLFELIKDEAEAIGVGVVSSQVIDTINIRNATMVAMRTAVERLPYPPDFLLIDGLAVPKIPVLQKGIVKGDRICLSIACASIIAKVTRDRIMVELDKSYPEYGLAIHKGYCTKYHLSCLTQQGPSSIHRYTFAPVKQFLRLV